MMQQGFAWVRIRSAKYTTGMMRIFVTEQIADEENVVVEFPWDEKGHPAGMFSRGAVAKIPIEEIVEDQTVILKEIGEHQKFAHLSADSV